MALTKEEKKALLKAYNEQKNKKYILKKRETASLFNYIASIFQRMGATIP